MNGRTWGFILCLIIAGPLAADQPRLEIVPVADVPYDQQPRFGGQSKTLLRTPNDGSLIWAHWPPRADVGPPEDPLGVHYHTWHEWAYVLDGDFVLHEPVSPRQRHGAAHRYRQGTWLDRPAHTLHGGTWVTGGIQSQGASTFILFEEGDGSVITLGPDGGQHFKPDSPDQDPDSVTIDRGPAPAWNRPWLVDTIGDLEWERDPEFPGRALKWLSDDPSRGFRARLVKVPAGFTYPDKVAGKYRHYDHAQRLIYLLYGDLRVWPGQDSTSRHVEADTLIHQPAGALSGFGNGPVSKRGAVWLEVTYARGYETGQGPIEKPKYVPGRK